MKFIIAYYLLLVYLVAVCKPLLPLAGDIIAHTFSYSDHITSVHEHNGDDHVHDELIDVAKESKSDDHSIVISDNVSVHIISENQYDFHGLPKKEVFQTANSSKHSSPVTWLITPPPKS